MITATKWIVIVVTVALVVYDIVVAVAPPGGDTLSEIIRDFARNWFFIPFAVGVLCGHWFWNVEKVDVGAWRYWVLAAIGCATLSIDFFVPLYVSPIIPLLFGIPIGHFLWPQRDGWSR